MKIRLRLRTLMIVVAALSLILAFASLLARTLHLIESGPSEAALHSMGDELVCGIEEWHSRHGSYPSSLKEAGLTSPTQYKGGFRYERRPTSFTLSIGVADGVNRSHTFYSDGVSKGYSNSGWLCAD